ncbi:MAG: hypothetical protein HY563_05635 [Ignavibacteriales bacterium]|nr:hypothetical protein [Ignavibacteriales bacterium]
MKYIAALVLYVAAPMMLLTQEPGPLARLQRDWLPETTAGPGKCGTPLIFDAMHLWPRMSLESRQSLISLLQRPPAQKNRLSAQSRFRIHYDSTGSHQPAMLQGDTLRAANSHEQYVDSVASILEYCWEREITGLGFAPPPPDNEEGGGNEYDVYIWELGPGTFGYTVWDASDALDTGPRQRYPTFIVLDRDFLGERTPGLAGLRVTAAHEFHHAIQVGAYGVWLDVPSSDFYFYELSSVWMEETVFDDINDYRFDLPNFFVDFVDARGQSRPFNAYEGAFRGYERSVWAFFLEDRFGADTMRKIWETMRSVPAVASMDQVLRGKGSDLRLAFLEFGTWNLFTSHRSKPGLYYREAQYFPSMTMNSSIVVSGFKSALSGSAWPWSLQYHGFLFSDDTLVAVLAHADLDQLYEGRSETFEVSVGSQTSSGAVQALFRGGSAAFLSASYENWRTRYVSTATGMDAGANSFPAPNPLRLAFTSVLTLPADGSFDGPADVHVLSPSLDLVYRGSYAVTRPLGKAVVTIPVSDFSSHVSSGVHFFHVKTAMRDYTWKLLLIR